MSAPIIITQEICWDELAPLLATASGLERVTAEIPTDELEHLLTAERAQTPTMDLGQLLRDELAAEDGTAVPAEIHDRPSMWKESAASGA
jgi:hypothetical protein